MDLLSSYKEKLNSFRINDLKNVLTRLGISKQGRKQYLVDRIVYLLSIEASELQDLAKGEVAGIIEEVFRKLQGTEATSSSVNEERFLEIKNLKPKIVQKMICCPCGSSLPIEPLIQCVDPHCGVLQHMSCVIVPHGSSEETVPALRRHYCEICRLNRADPFRATVTQLLSPAKLMTLSIPHDGSNPVQNVEKTFQLSKTDKNFLRHNDFNVQAWCILLNDKVQFRMQWPLYADLKVNGVPVRTVTRPGSQLLGANGRDDGPMIAFYMVDGLNRISLSGWDARSFCLGVRIVKENTVQQILDLILNEQTGETFEDALARVHRCIGGGMAMATEDSDSDLEVISDFVTVNLRCPMGGYRIKTAGRFRPCAHMGCFDLETFVQLNQRSRKWQCPICLKNYSLEDITVDPYFNRITKMMEDCEEDVTEIDVKFDGSWRVKKGGGFENFDLWRLPDGRACYSTTEMISSPAASMRIKGEGVIEYTDRKLSKLCEIPTMSHQQEHFGSYSVTSMSCSSFESRGDGDHNVDQNTASLSDLDVIVLSDSDEETPSLMCTEPVCKPKVDDDVGHAGSAPGVPNPVTESMPCDVGLSSSSGTCSCKENDYFTFQPTFSSNTWSGSEFQPLHTHDVFDASVDPEYPTVTSPLPICGSVLTSNCKANHDREFICSSPCQSNNLDSSQGCDLNPPQSSSQKSPCTLLQSQICHNRQISNGTNEEDFTLVGCGSNSDVVNGAARDHSKVLISGCQDFVNRDDFNEALSVDKKVRSELTMGREMSNSPFSFPRRARSARQRSS